MKKREIEPMDDHTYALGEWFGPIIFVISLLFLFGEGWTNGLPMAKVILIKLCMGAIFVLDMYIISATSAERRRRKLEKTGGK